MDLLPILYALSTNKPRFVLTAGIVAISLAIGGNCVALVLDAREKMSVKLGFDDTDLVVGVLPVPKTSLRDSMKRDVWIRNELEELRSLPGVRSLSESIYVLWNHGATSEIRAADTTDELFRIGLIGGDEFFLDTVGLELDEGRWFTHDEVEQAKGVLYSDETRARLPNGKAREPGAHMVVITRALGQRLFGDGPLLGKRIEDQDGDVGTIIGVVRDFYNPALEFAHAERYTRFLTGYGHNYARGGGFIARAEPGKADELAQRINEWANTRYDQSGRLVRTAVEMHDLYFGPQRMLAGLMTFLVFLLLFITSLGIAGITSFSITERARHIGIRRALGATPNDISAYFLTETGIITFVGLVVGAGLAVPLNMDLVKFYDAAKLSPTILAGCAMLLFLVSLGAAFPAALRASKVSPAIATRNV